MPRAQMTRALRSLAASGAVELQTFSQSSTAAVVPDLRRGLAEYAEIRQRYGAWWPPVEPQSVDTAEEPSTQLAAALAALRVWADEAAPTVARLQDVKTRAGELEMIREGVVAGRHQLPDLEALAGAGPWLDRRLYLLPPRVFLREVPHGILHASWPSGKQRFLLVVGRRTAVEELDQKLVALRARPLRLPDRLPAAPAEAAADIDRRLAACEETLGEQRAVLEGINERCGLAAILGRIHLLEWYADNVPALAATEHFAWITGWTSDRDGAELRDKLTQDGVRYLLRLSDPPAGAVPPSVLRNPVWVRPFELFASLLGTPGVSDVDPSRLLAVMAPLMFGYMFGDVGHGLVLLLAGLLLRERVPALALLVPGGAASIVFGFLFGSIFGIEHVLPALWLHPMEHPLIILGASLGFGVVVVTLGLVLDALQCHWRGEAGYYWGARVGLGVTYAGLLASLWQPAALWLVILAAAWFIGGSARLSPGKAGAAATTAAMDYGETLLQLVVNTISFVRVGAFALAHGGLSAAVLGIADAADSLTGRIIVLVLGNALVIALEGLVVSIQTTRLVLFEFFIRFLRGSGRNFRPLPMPAGIDQQLGRNPK